VLVVALAQQTVSIWTVGGRLKGVRFACGEHQRRLLACRRGESDLLFRDGRWLLLATCEVPEQPQQPPVGMLGVDLGIVNIATTSDGARYCGSHLNRVRHRHRRLRRKLQRNGSRAPSGYSASAAERSRGLSPMSIM
jgi:putative transposase